MNKRIASLGLVFVMVLSLLATAVSAMAATPVELKVTADKTSANPGDTINYEVSIGAVTDMGGLEFKLDIPSGLSIVDGSISIPDGLETTIDSDGAIIVPTSSNSYYWCYSAQLTGYTGTSDLVLLTFSCTVDAETSGTKNVSIKEVTLIDQDVNDMDFNVTGVDVGVTAPHVHVFDQENTTLAGALKTAATCTADAVYFKSCTCGELSTTDTFVDAGSALGHDFTKKTETDAYLKAEAANCTEHNEYWYACSRCGEKSPDASFTGTASGAHSFTKEIADDAHYVAGTGADCLSAKQYYYGCEHCDAIGTATWTSTVYGPHDYSDKWSSDTDNHWHECSKCHDRKDVAAHTPDRAEATETEGIHCTECGYTIAGPLGHTHSMTKEDAVAATCTEDGHVAYYTCSGCGKWFEDAAGTKEITDHSKVVISAKGHDWKAATCTEPKTCKACGATEGTALGHTDSGWKMDADGHWKICTVCKEITVAKAAHTPDRAEATETEGIHCTECGYTIAEPLGHTHSLTKVDAAAATCTEDGVIEHYKCDGCGKLFADANASKELTADQIVAEATGHDYQWVIDKEATATEAGSKHEECTKCGDSKAAVEIPATGTPDEPIKPDEPVKPADPDSPKTGDSGMILWIALALVCGGAAVGATTWSRKRKA